MQPGDLPSTFCLAGRPSFYLRQHLVWLGDFPSTFHATGRLSINFRQLSAQPKDIPSTYRASGKSSAKFRLLSMRQGELPLTFDNFPYGQDTFRQLLSAFLAAGKPSFYFCYFLCDRETLSTSINFSCRRQTFWQLL